MSALFWITCGVMAVSMLVGVVQSLRLYDRIGGGATTASADLDRLVRESW
jgi:hypothetical protein